MRIFFIISKYPRRLMVPICQVPEIGRRLHMAATIWIKSIAAYLSKDSNPMYSLQSGSFLTASPTTSARYPSPICSHLSTNSCLLISIQSKCRFLDHGRSSRFSSASLCVFRFVNLLCHKIYAFSESDEAPSFSTQQRYTGEGEEGHPYWHKLRCCFRAEYRPVNASPGRHGESVRTFER